MVGIECELLRRERVAGIGLLAADVAHEINNPMNAILGLSELSLQATGRGPLSDAARNELHESLTVIRREAVRCKEIVERLMAMVRVRGESQWFDATRLLVETVEVAMASRPDKARCFHVLRSGQPVQVFAPSHEVRQIILTLLINAADARQAADYVNRHTSADDVVIGSPPTAWLFDSQAADFQMVVAATGEGTVHFPPDLPADRFAFDPRYTGARFVVVDNLWGNWGAVHIPGVLRMLREVEMWPLVFEAGAVQVYRNPER